VIVEGVGEVSRKLAKTSNRMYRPSEKQRPDAIVAGANKRLASRFYQLKTGHCLTGQCLQWTTRRPDTKCLWCQYSIHPSEPSIQELPPMAVHRCQQKSRQPSWRPRRLLADERCSQAVLVFLATTDVGRTLGPPVAGGGGGEASEASEWEDRVREERLAFLREEAERLGAGG